ncbi:MAG TPA: glucan biosynthesis protein, partial [Nevskiaceae bacterium]|nr:glucan biosynthesis protein [Nevskiaceae bacterium]
MQRRDFLIAGAAAASVLPLRGFAAASAQPFDYAWLKGQARALAGRAYVAPSRELPEALAALDYDGYQSIRFKPERSLWYGDDLAFRAQFFHRGYRLREAVRIHEIVNGQARELAYDAAQYDFAKTGIKGSRLPHDLGYAGFRLQFRTNWAGEFMVFLGASYFRAIGGDNRQYGTSARGLAIDVGQDSGEEFPRFTEFWLERPAAASAKLVVYALLDSPSVSGAYRFEIAPGNLTVMLCDVALYPRREIKHLGLAPLTSMFYTGENDRHGADWRPEIHDSDGLALWTGGGEWIWRPLVNPPGTHLNSFLDQKPHGYGLLQRDRDFDHFLDDAVYYEH